MKTRPQLIGVLVLAGVGAYLLYTEWLQHQGARRGSGRIPGRARPETTPLVVSLDDPFIETAEYLEAAAGIESIQI